MKWKYTFQSQQYIEKELVTVNIEVPSSRKPEACRGVLWPLRSFGRRREPGGSLPRMSPGPPRLRAALQEKRGTIAHLLVELLRKPFAGRQQLSGVSF